MTTIELDSHASFDELLHVDTVVSTLPVSFRRVAENPDAHAISGRSGWTDRAIEAIHSGSAGVVVIDAVLEDVSELAALVESSGVGVVLDRGWTHSTMVGSTQSAIDSAATSCQFIEATRFVETANELRSGALDLLSVLDRIVGALSGHLSAVVSSHTWIFESAAPTHPAIRATVAVCPPLETRTSIRIYTEDERFTLDLPSRDSALPTRLSACGPGSTVISSGEYVSARRSAWQSFRDLIEQGNPIDDLPRFQRTLRLVDHATSGSR